MVMCSRKHYREYLVSLINSHSVDPAPLYSSSELLLACKRYKVEETRRDGEDSFTYYSRLLEVSWWGKRCFRNCMFAGWFLGSHLRQWIVAGTRCPNRVYALVCQMYNYVLMHVCSGKSVGNSSGADELPQMWNVAVFLTLLPLFTQLQFQIFVTNILESFEFYLSCCNKTTRQASDSD